MITTEVKRKELHTQHAVWLVKHKRPFNTVDDHEYRKLWDLAFAGAYTPPTSKMVHAEVLVLSAAAQQRIKREVSQLMLGGRKLYITSDIWSSHGVHFFGGTMYWIENWKIVERLLFAEPFHLAIHDAANIEIVAKKCMVDLGFPSADPGAMVEMKVNDHAGNIMNGMNAI
jgi:hypothetical protein